MVYADTFTKLDYVEGDVSVERAGERLEVVPGMEIFEEDQIQTGENGLAVIKYFDDSISRLSADSKLLVSSLKKDGNSFLGQMIDMMRDNIVVESSIERTETFAQARH